ncbi:MAG TPA: hypothetical protein VHP32_08080 [Ignavibacteria bacterium]|nr:hypothetical protein [Ignavibacteria bacterium]
MKIILIIFFLLIVSSSNAQIYENSAYAGSFYKGSSPVRAFYKLIPIFSNDTIKHVALELIYDKPTKIDNGEFTVTSEVYYIEVYCNIDKIANSVINYFRDDELQVCFKMNGVIQYNLNIINIFFLL